MDIDENPNSGPLSAQRIRDLESIEEVIVEIINTAAHAIMGLALDGKQPTQDGEDDFTKKDKSEKLTLEQQEENFKEFAQKFANLIEEIQIKLRVQFRHMRNMGITAGDIPFYTVTYGEAKEYESWMNAAKILRKKLDNISVAADGLQDSKSELMEVDE
ncbi:26528_t:CDS:2 [Dentiscutata erythropus]|uniref:Mediator of RNA polymerase II transcription subunit 11 n=1 Tax=Dentiscutata erythropus TaxID=1348616 RepID=A0A9N9AKD2_9GLOM|nr:26528_t:CDS:2 [Dentiscutata erythropus]